jgi:translation initiation factor IF-1
MGSIEGVGRVQETLKPGLFRVQMSNGHEIMAFLGRKEANLVDSLTKGTQVCVSLTPFDMSKGRILKILDQENESKTVSKKIV